MRTAEDQTQALSSRPTALDSVRPLIDNVPFVLPNDKPVVVTISRDIPRPETIAARAASQQEAFDVDTLAFD